MDQEQLLHYIDELLDAPRFRDYCPNGLQVEGRREVRTIVTGVTASAALLEAARDKGADVVLVHHGLFWRGDDPRIVGPRRARIALLLAAEMGLLAYHLPLDAHRELGNNAQLAARIGLSIEGWFGDQEIAAHGSLSMPATLGQFASLIETRLGRKPLVIGDSARPVRRVAWCTGAAQGMIEEAARLKVDVYLTGEVSEQTVHFAQESGVAFIAAGHHATERYGIEALGKRLADRFGLQHRFIDLTNPV